MKLCWSSMFQLAANSSLLHNRWGVIYGDDAHEEVFTLVIFDLQSRDNIIPAEVLIFERTLSWSRIDYADLLTETAVAPLSFLVPLHEKLYLWSG